MFYIDWALLNYERARQDRPTASEKEVSDAKVRSEAATEGVCIARTLVKANPASHATRDSKVPVS